ncbi:MFS transporter [Arthrobacter mobilis]|uniref:Sugar porter family MFS transporter n=1 Tax=Arthrobacter mobilis TaxID=2724944 RepID=A0A7X6K5T5_9MICC|nr:MFS transporter [Arthrobacter mobilis]NKX54245.1 sugar porter family MFS transporter [Arthrobacter mobilis]
MTPFLWRVTTFTVGGMFCDGFILGGIGVALTLAAPALGLSDAWIGAIGAASLFGILFGSLAAGYLSDRFGRQKLLIADLLLLLAGSLAHLVVTDEVQLTILRFIMGIAIGAEYAIGAALMSELIPRKGRGALLASLNAGWILGFVAAYVVSFLMRDAGASWQLILASSAVPVVAVLLLRIGSPESVRWLITQGRTAEAEAIVHRFYGPEYGVQGLEPVTRGQRNFSRLFSPEYRSRAIFAGVFWACQVIPLFALTIFLPQALGALGVEDEFAASMLVNGMLVLGAATGVLGVQKFSRRGFVIWTFVATTAALAVVSFADYMPLAIGLLAFALFVLIGSAASNLEYVYPSEIFPTEIRSSGIGFATAVSRIGSAVSTFMLPIALGGLGNQVTMLLLAAVSLAGVIVSALWAPETKNLSLAESAAAGTARRMQDRTEVAS